MPYYRSLGDVPRKRHIQHRTPDGGLYAEELVGIEGFSHDSALLYHRHLPTAIVDAVAVSEPDPGLAPNLPLLAAHYRTHALGGGTPGADAVSGRQVLLANADVRLSYVAATSSSGLYRNAIGDEVLYVESGAGVVETSYGLLTISAGDYVVLPTSTTYRVRLDGPDPLRLFVIEASGHVGPPRRYLSPRGQFLEHAPWCERDIRGPEDVLVVEGTDVEVTVRSRQGLTRYTYANHPFDVVGWDGCNYPYVVSIHDFEPITGRLHQPPPVHQMFDGPNFVVCSFVPRLFDYHPLSIPAPYNHANVDSDEVLFYCGGDFMSRKGAGIEMGSISLHPAGFTHGPQPGSVEASIGAPSTNEVAVMVDTFRPLQIGDAARACEDPAYPWLWSGRSPR
jgi:homogentisate 1,2-dioxygenase